VTQPERKSELGHMVSRRTWSEARKALTRLQGRVRSDPLLRNSLFIMTTTVVNSALGYVFWFTAARLFTTSIVGLAAALIATSSIVALLAYVGVGMTLTQSLPQAGSAPNWALTFWTGSTAAFIVSLVSGAAAVVILPTLSVKFAVLDHPGYAVIFVVGTIAWTVGVVIDYAYVAERAAGNMLSRNTVIAGGKVLALLLLAVLVARTSLEIISAWALAAVVGLLAGVGLLIHCVGIVRLRRPPLGAMARKAAWLRSRLVGHQLISMGGQLPPFLLPVIVTTRLSTSQNAYFYVTWMTAGVFLIISPAVSHALFVEGAHSERDLRNKARYALAIIGVLLAPCIVAFLLAGGVILSTFGPAYEHHALLLLRLVVLSSIPDALTNVYVVLLRVQLRLATAAWLNLGMGIGTVSLSFALLPLMGIAAVGFSWLTMQVAGCVVGAIDLRRGGLLPPPSPGQTRALDTA
jgi:O-antigen/teichoic acid export membrane protein